MKRTFFLRHAQARQSAIQCIKDSPDGFMVTVREPTRSLDAIDDLEANWGKA